MQKIVFKMGPQNFWFLLYRITEIWRGMNSQSQPYGVWIVAYDTLGPDKIEIDTLPNTAWYLDWDGIQPRSLWDYARYVFAQVNPSYVSIEQDPITPPLGVGRAFFAEYLGSGDVYFEAIWNEQDYGGYRIKINSCEGVFQVIEKLWP